MLDKIVYASIAGGLAIAGAGISYVVTFESRLSKLETQIGFISGASSAITSDKPNEAKVKNIKDLDDIGVNHGVEAKDTTGQISNEIKSTLVKSCANMLDTYDGIVSEGALYSSEKDRLQAITEQMKLLGCDNILK